MPSRLRILALALLAAALAGCAHRQPPQPDYDPWEPFNRKMFAFNDGLDRYALEPIARGWDYVVPNPVERAISRFFNNIRFPIVFVNDLLQGKPHQAAAALARFQINTFFGGLGFYDLADDWGLPPQDEDMAQTFGVWDIAPGPYLVLPFFGPSSPRDALGLAGDFAFTAYLYFIPIPWASVGATAINIINERSLFLDTVERAKEASLDYYIFVRNAYVQRRWKQINDTLTTTPGEEDELYNEEIYEGYLEEGDVTK